MKSARAFFQEVNKRFPTLPFSIRAFEDSTAAKVGVKECLNHDLLTPYPVLVEKAGEIVAQFKCTIAILPKSTIVLAGEIPFAKERFSSNHTIQDETLKALIDAPLWKKEDKKKAAKKEETTQ